MEKTKNDQYIKLQGEDLSKQKFSLIFLYSGEIGINNADGMVFINIGIEELKEINEVINEIILSKKPDAENS